jgi:hypothetical protein
MQKLESSDNLNQIDSTANIYTSCCKQRIDKRIIIISAQIAFSAISLIFSFVEIAKKNDDGGQFLSVITSILGFWLGKASDI